MLDFEIKKEVLPVISVNFEEMKQALNTKMDEYKGIVVTEEGLSVCKADQKELAGIRNKIDTYRKEKKKDLSKPITEFENQCKELISLVEKAEQPIKEGIATFDNRKREEKKQKALEIIQNTVQAHQLNEKYASKLTVLDKYLNLTASIKGIKEDIEQRAFFLAEEQAKEAELLQTIQTTIDNANKGIKTHITMNDVEYLININTPLPTIIERINQMAEKIRLAEAPKEEAIKEPAPIVEKVTPIETKTINNYVSKAVEEELYFIELKVIGTSIETAQLGEYLRNNNYKYKVINKGLASDK